MSKQRLVIMAVLAGQSQSAVARRYGVSQGWISKMMARYRVEGEAAFEPRSRRPKNIPSATSDEVVDIIVGLRRRLVRAGLDAGAETIAWHLEHTHKIVVHRATIHRILTRHNLVTPEPSKRPKSSYKHFAADQPNECWQSDFTHYRLTRPDGRPGADAEIITWIDDHSRYALHISAHRRITAKIVADTFHQAGQQHGYPASTLTDNGMVYTVRLAGDKNTGGRTILESELRRLGIIQKNGTPHHPQTQGKVERFQATMKKWLAAQPDQPTTIDGLQTLIDAFLVEYNYHRPHRALPRRATPATVYTTGIKAAPRHRPHARLP
jgi:transposase InsO family protein